MNFLKNFDKLEEYFQNYTNQFAASNSLFHMVKCTISKMTLCTLYIVDWNEKITSLAFPGQSFKYYFYISYHFGHY